MIKKKNTCRKLLFIYIFIWSFRPCKLLIATELWQGIWINIMSPESLWVKSKFIYYILHLIGFGKYDDNHCPYYWSFKIVIPQHNRFRIKPNTMCFFLSLCRSLQGYPSTIRFLDIISCHGHQGFSDAFLLSHMKF